MKMFRVICGLALASAGCAAPLQRAPAAAAVPRPPDARPAPPDEGRPSIGVAFGGGSARGIAHIGVIRWFEEHRIPIDVAAGTSMGGLVGGAFATGMNADELDGMIEKMDWDDLFGSSSFAFKNIRRKADARAYPSRIEFGMKGGIVPPPSLNNGEQVELFLGRIAAAYHDMPSFNALPTPFRMVAVDLVSASEVVLDHGSLATAMRATMSLPLIFPPVELEGRVLVDGGAMNNVPADVVRAMGADRVVAINVGQLEDREALSYTLLSVAGATIEAMTRASTLRALTSADVVIDVPLKGYGSLDWRRSAELIKEGYNAAEAKREQLLPLAVSEEQYSRWRQQREGRRRRDPPIIAFANADPVGFAPGDADRLKAVLPRHVGKPLDVNALQQDLAPMTGLDRYQTVTWRLATNAAGENGLVVTALPKSYAPPFLMLGLNLENTTSNDFRISLTGRYLSYGVLGSGSELRLDGTLGSDPGVAVELYEPIGSTPFFVAPNARVRTSTFNVIRDDAVYARYGQTTSAFAINLGANLGARSDVRAGLYVGRVDSSVEVGDPGFPEVEGSEAAFDAVWRLDTQDSYVIPSGGALSDIKARYVFDSADLVGGQDVQRPQSEYAQLSGTVTQFWSFGERTNRSAEAKNRLFMYAGAGTSFDGNPLPTNKFSLGSPLRLGAYRQGELLGNHYYVATAGYLRQVGRLPDFMGGSIFAGGWLENGDAFRVWSDATVRTNWSVGLIADTLIGPVLVAGSGGFSGEWRTYIGVGRLFR